MIAVIVAIVKLVIIVMLEALVVSVSVPLVLNSPVMCGLIYPGIKLNIEEYF